MFRKSPRRVSGVIETRFGYSHSLFWGFRIEFRGFSQMEYHRDHNICFAIEGVIIVERKLSFWM